MTKIQNSKPVSVIWYWNLRFVCNLVLGVWDFIIPSLHHSSRLPHQGKTLEATLGADQIRILRARTLYLHGHIHGLAPLFLFVLNI